MGSNVFWSIGKMLKLTTILRHFRTSKGPMQVIKSITFWIKGYYMTIKYFGWEVDAWWKKSDSNGNFWLWISRWNKLKKFGNIWTASILTQRTKWIEIGKKMSSQKIIFRLRPWRKESRLWTSKKKFWTSRISIEFAHFGIFFIVSEFWTRSRSNI